MAKRKRGTIMSYKEGRLGYNGKNKRYGLLISDLWEKDGFHCGNHMEVCLNGEWIPTQIEMDSKEQWYLTGIDKAGTELEGLKVRIETE